MKVGYDTTRPMEGNVANGPAARSAWTGYVAAVGLELAVTALLVALEPHLPLSRHAAPHILVIMLVAYLFGSGPAILAFLIGLFLFDYYFVPPLHIPLPHAENPAGWAAITSFMLGTTIVGIATVAMRRARHRSERVAASLGESEERLSLAQRAGRVGVFDWDVSTGKVTWTPELEEIFGIPVGSFEGNYEGWKKRVHPDDVERLAPYFDKWICSRRTEGEWEYRFLCPSGEMRWMAARAQVIRDAKGKALRMIGTNLDITERRTGDERLRQLNLDLAVRNAELDAERQRWQGVVEGIADEVWICDSEGMMTLLNLRSVTPMGLEEFRDRSVEEVLQEVDILDFDGQLRPAEQAPLFRSLRGEIVRGEEIMRHRGTGRVRYRLYSSAPTRDADGSITGAVAIVRDITDLKDMQEERERALRELEGLALELRIANEELATANQELEVTMQELRDEVEDRKRAEDALKEEQEHKLEFYQKTILAATDGKLVITDRPMDEHSAGPVVGIWDIHRSMDVSAVRHAVEELCASAGLNEPRLGQLILAVGEAATNAYRHAGVGQAVLRKSNETLSVTISDKGPGIPALSVPDIALRRGYSTAGTLGMGYKVMIAYTDKVYLTTGPGGTTVALEMKLHPEEQQSDPWMSNIAFQGGSL